MTSLISTAMRPKANMWGALVNVGSPAGGRASTAFFGNVTSKARIFIREATPSIVAQDVSGLGANATSCAIECADVAPLVHQCKQAQCSSVGTCIYELNKEDGAPCTDGDDETYYDECEQGECRGWYIVGYQSAPLTRAEATAAANLELVQSGNESFNLERIAQLKDGRNIVDLALVFPGTLFSMQVWSQESLPWERRTSAKGFDAKRVTLAGFNGLVGGDPSDPYYSVMRVPGLQVEVGATSAYLGGIAGPGVLPVPTVELYARASNVTGFDDTARFATAAGASAAIVIVLALFGLQKRKQTLNLRAFKGMRKSLLPMSYEEQISVAEAGARDTRLAARKEFLRASRAKIKIKQNVWTRRWAREHGKRPTNAEKMADATWSAMASNLQSLDMNLALVNVQHAPSAAGSNDRSGRGSANKGSAIDGIRVMIEAHGAKERWQLVMRAIANRDGPFNVLALHEKHADRMRALREMFKGPDGKVDPSKKMRLQALERRSKRKSIQEVKAAGGASFRSPAAAAALSSDSFQGFASADATSSTAESAPRTRPSVS